MMPGLVAVRILPDQPGDVGWRVGGQGRGRVEEGIDLRFIRRIAAEMRDQPVNVVLVEERRLPAIRLGICPGPLAKV